MLAVHRKAIKMRGDTQHPTPRIVEDPMMTRKTIEVICAIVTAITGVVTIAATRAPSQAKASRKGEPK